MEIIKYRSPLLAQSDQVTVLRRAQNALVRLGRTLTDKLRKLQEILRARENVLQNVLASSLDAIVVTNGKVTKFRSQLLIASDQVTVYLRRAHNALMRLGRTLTDQLRKLQEVLRARENVLQNVLASSHDAIVVTSGKITKFRSQLLIASDQLTVHLRRTQNTLTRVGRRVVDKPRRLQKALRAREKDLRKLLASSLDAVIVTDVHRRLVAANPKALDLFGVSEANMRKFTIDAFLSHGQIPYFDGSGSPFIGREERHGECKIRRLDGSLRAAEYIFVANFVPYRHLCRFHNAKTAQVKFIATFNYGHGNDSNAGQLH